MDIEERGVLRRCKLERLPALATAINRDLDPAEIVETESRWLQATRKSVELDAHAQRGVGRTVEAVQQAGDDREEQRSV